ncbi:cysteine proteinase [Stemphylium lycopersici]|uniref:ubiquitinyl hydrolase 1 n=1 Tax=Stemphylium lycopersici TaxID=183478 RepID=A0A364MS61_STELY|nr:peptidase c19 ubiquitin carboxyl-terminal hydrolase 2 [Stemphylium lycopersici]RAR01375.1 cysteine proteinase [Stemphylium lycopersici]RAR01582.1 cysteine proteinase [Stemphylium lycopersici]
MATEMLRLRGTSFGSASGSESNDDETMQNGGMFGSLFGISPGNLLQKGVRGMASALSMGPSDVPPGLGNISNSCYQNSVIQGLASLPSLREHLNKTTSQHPSLSPESTNGALFDIITKLNDPQNTGHHFWIRGKLKSMSTFEQQDAQEYYSKILDALDEEVKKTASSKRRSSVSWVEVTKSLSDSPDAGEKAQEGAEDAKDKSGAPVEQAPPNPLEGRLAQRVGCTSCGYSEGLTLIPFNCITVSLGKNYGYDIRECLDEYTTLEFIDGVECAKCTLLKLQKTLVPLVARNPDSPLKGRLDAVQEALEKEDFEDKTLLKTLNLPKKNWVQSTKSKQAVVARAPQSLVLHVNRSSFNEYTGMPFKNTAGVSYPTVLDLGNWCLGGAPTGSKQPAMSEEEWPRDPRQSMLSKGLPMADSPFQYQLRAAVTHYGSHGNGHYVCYRSHPRSTPKPEDKEAIENSSIEDESGEDEKEQQASEETNAPAPSEQWWRFSDDSVYPVSEEEAHQGNVFMLFYERIDDSTPAPSQPAQENATAITEDAPLPPADVATYTQNSPDEEAISLALPEDDDDLLDLIPASSPPESASPPHLAVPATEATLDSSPITTPPSPAPSSQPAPSETSATDDDDMESNDAPSTQLTSDYESEAHAHAPTPPKSVHPSSSPSHKVSPNTMRTAGNAASGRGRRKRQSLPLVSAT